ncbi:MAG TPA: iron ABC transporter permease, partial [Thermotogota bacterium]|nr:iron ABC transporter permease [Thermotogota bacterium]
VLNSVRINPKQFSPTFEHYGDTFSSRGFFRALGNTLWLATGATLLSLVLGGSLAFLSQRTDIFFRKAIRALVLLAFTIPSYIMGVAWIQLLGNKGLLSFVPFPIYSLPGVGWVMALHLYPMAFLGISSALKRVDFSSEEAARLDGCSHFQVFSRVVFPVILPSVLSLAVFIFARSVACFGVAALLALPSREYILSTFIYRSLSTLELEKAVTVSVVMMTLTVLLFLVEWKLSRNVSSENGFGQSGKTTVKLKKWRVPVFLGVNIFFLVTLFLPLLSTTMTALVKSWGMDWKAGNFTFSHFVQLFDRNGPYLIAMKNSLLFGVFTASGAVVLSLGALFVVNRTRARVGPFLSLLCTLPAAIPEIILAMAAIFAWMNPPLRLYNTPWILFLGYLVPAIPFAFKNLSGLIHHIPYTFEEMAMVQGASRAQAFRRITLPQLSPGIRAGWILGFLFVLREIPISILLYSPGNETIGVRMF